MAFSKFFSRGPQIIQQVVSHKNTPVGNHLLKLLCTNQKIFGIEEVEMGSFSVDLGLQKPDSMSTPQPLGFCNLSQNLGSLGLTHTFRAIANPSEAIIGGSMMGAEIETQGLSIKTSLLGVVDLETFGSRSPWFTHGGLTSLPSSNKPASLLAFNEIIDLQSTYIPDTLASKNYDEFCECIDDEFRVEVHQGKYVNNSFFNIDEFLESAADGYVVLFEAATNAEPIFLPGESKIHIMGKKF